MQTKSLGLSLAALSFGLAGVMSCFPTFWAIATDYLPARRAAFGIALINSIAATGGFVSPYTVGFIKTATGSMMYAFVPTITVMVLAAIVMVLGVSADRLRRAS
jgi:hypothetical protein